MWPVSSRPSVRTITALGSYPPRMVEAAAEIVLYSAVPPSAFNAPVLSIQHSHQAFHLGKRLGGD